MSVRDQYPPGKKFKVMRPNCRLSGWVHSDHGGYKGWTRNLQVGDVITSAGFGAGFGSDPGYGIHFRSDEAMLVQFYPSEGGAFAYHPAQGCLKPVEDEDE